MDKGIEELLSEMKAAALKASNGEWVKESGDGWEATCSADDQTNEGFIVAHFEGPDAAANREFVQAANPANVLALIAALELAQQRVEELENDEVRQRLANAEHQLHMAELAKYNMKTSRRAQFRKRLDAEKRIAELEARPLCVKLSRAYSIRPGHPINEDERNVMIPKDNGNWFSRWDVEHAIRAAGGTVEGE